MQTFINVDLYFRSIWPTGQTAKRNARSSSLPLSPRGCNQWRMKLLVWEADALALPTPPTNIPPFIHHEVVTSPFDLGGWNGCREIPVFTHWPVPFLNAVRLGCWLNRVTIRFAVMETHRAHKYMHLTCLHLNTTAAPIRSSRHWIREWKRSTTIVKWIRRLRSHYFKRLVSSPPGYW